MVALDTRNRVVRPDLPSYREREHARQQDQDPVGPNRRSVGGDLAVKSLYVSTPDVRHLAGAELRRDPLPDQAFILEAAPLALTWRVFCAIALDQVVNGRRGSPLTT